MVNKVSDVYIFDATKCELGEGVFWHPLRNSLFWFDILNRKLCERDRHSGANGPRRVWEFDEIVSAGGWIDEHRLLLASESGLYDFDLRDASFRRLCNLEIDMPENRSNDGRADRLGGFWIGTMHKEAREGKGSIYRWFQGELRKLFDNITIPNALCFSQDGDYAYFADSPKQLVWKIPLDWQGWPKGNKEIFLDYRGQGFFPDGAVIDSQGWFWIALWGAGKVVAYNQHNQLQAEILFPTPHISCPAFGGSQSQQFFVTSAMENLTSLERSKPEAGVVFIHKTKYTGIPEPAVVIPS